MGAQGPSGPGPGGAGGDRRGARVRGAAGAVSQVYYCRQLRTKPLFGTRQRIQRIQPKQLKQPKQPKQPRGREQCSESRVPAFVQELTSPPSLCPNKHQFRSKQFVTVKAVEQRRQPQTRLRLMPAPLGA